MIWFWHLSRISQQCCSNDCNFPSWVVCLLLSIAEKKHDICKIKSCFRLASDASLLHISMGYVRKTNFGAVMIHWRCFVPTHNASAKQFYDLFLFAWRWRHIGSIRSTESFCLYYNARYKLATRTWTVRCTLGMSQEMHSAPAFCQFMFINNSISVLKICSLFDWMRRNRTSGVVASAVCIFNWNIEIEIVVFEINHNFRQIIH